MRWCLWAAVVSVSLALGAMAPSRASAWVDASIRSARAALRVDEHARVHVVLDVTLRVDGGWLEALELDGLDAGLALDPLDPATMVRAPSSGSVIEGSAPVSPFVAEALEPTVTTHDDGRVVLSFTRRRAPRRGDYLVHVAYDAPLAAVSPEGDGVHVRWTFPAWRFGLDTVHVELDAPTGATPVLEEDTEIDVEASEVEGHAHVVLTRAHLARTREWVIELVVPAASMDPSLSVLAAETPRASLRDDAPSTRSWHGAAALLVAGLVVALRIARRSARERAEGVRERPLVPLPSGIAAGIAAALGVALAALAWLELDARALVAGAALLSLLVLSRGAPSPTAPRIGSFRQATPSLRRAARRARLLHTLGLDAWLDATTPPGVLSIAGLAALALHADPGALGPVAIAGALVLVAQLSDPRARRVEPALVTLDRMLRLARRARVDLGSATPVALMPVVHLDVRGAAQEARLRVVGALPEGTLRADVVLARRGLFGARHGLLVVTARASALDDALAADPRFVHVATGGERVARITPLDPSRLDAALAVLISAAPGAQARPTPVRDAA